MNYGRSTTPARVQTRRSARVARDRSGARQSGTVTETLSAQVAAALRRDADGLIAAVVREEDTGQVLMLAWMDDEALHRTLRTGQATYWSRSRGRHWVKGETSGHYQEVRSVALDCDGDAVLLTVRQTGPACHTGAHSCFHRELPMAPEGAQ